MGCGGRGSAERDAMAGRVSRERSTSAQDERHWTRLRKCFDGRALSGKTSWRRCPRTAKPCGPGTRCWCQVGGGVARPTGSRKTANPPATVARRIRRRGEHGI